MAFVIHRSGRPFVFLLIIVLLSVVGLAAAMSYTAADQIYPGVRIGGVDVGGLTVAEAKERIQALVNERLGSSPITLRYENRSWAISAPEIDLTVDASALAAQAFAVGRSGDIFTRLMARYLAANKGYEIPLSIVFDQNKLIALLDKIIAAIDTDARNATLVYDWKTGLVKLVPEILGKKVNKEKTLQELMEKLNTEGKAEVAIRVETVYPAVVAADLAGNMAVLASYTTEFNQQDKNRCENLRLAVNAITDHLIKPGDVFSFNAVVGPRTQANGYKIAPVMVDGELVPDWGGGVCQVSSTLYNAALLAGLEVIERTPHYRPPGYVPLGLDATVTDSGIDLKMKNNLDGNVFVKAETYGNTLSVLLFGKPKNKADIRVFSVVKNTIEPNVTIKQDPKLDLGKEEIEAEGQKGFVVASYRVWITAGKEVKREHISTDEYKPMDRIIRLGTKVSDTQTLKIK